MQKLSSRIKEFKDKKILVVGDIGLDEYVMGSVRRISPEAPVPVLEVEKVEYRLGLSTNVAQNVRTLGGEPILLSVIGNDDSGRILKENLSDFNIDPEFLITDESRPTTRKLRALSGNHHIVRVDYEKRKYIDSITELKLIEQFNQLVSTVEAIVLQDYAKGVITRELVSNIHKVAKEKQIPLLVDPHRTTPLEFYENSHCEVFKPNKEEAIVLAGISLQGLDFNDDTIREVALDLKRKTSSKNVIITMGGEGMLLINDNGINIIPTMPRQVYDVTGAGDTAISALALSWSAGFDEVDSIKVANAASGIVVEKIGCIPCSSEELKASLEKY